MFVGGYAAQEEGKQHDDLKPGSVGHSDTIRNMDGIVWDSLAVKELHGLVKDQRGRSNTKWNDSSKYGWAV